MKVSIYSTPTCTYCKHAKDFFAEKGIAYEEFDVAADAEKRAYMLEISGSLGVPVIQIDDKVVVGYDKDTLVELLGITA